MMVRFHRSPASRQQQSSEKPQILFYDETKQLSVHISAKVQQIKVIYNTKVSARKIKLPRTVLIMRKTVR